MMTNSLFMNRDFASFNSQKYAMHNLERLAQSALNEKYDTLGFGNYARLS
jgi:hypothetical protein